MTGALARGLTANKRNNQRRRTTKTGCGTCRTRRVKCDENKPLCQRCVDTGRQCDGYTSLFRVFTSDNIDKTHAAIKLGASVRRNQPTFSEIAFHDIHILNRYFSTKTIFDVTLNCEDDARRVLQASLTVPPVRQAVSSLRALREDYEKSGEVPAATIKQTPIYDYGLQQYCMALKGLALNLSSSTSTGVKSALLCCQVFISIEQVRMNYAAMTRHMSQGLKIMHEYRAGPSFIAATNEVVPAHEEQLPCLDVFIIRLFAAPCKFTVSPTTSSTTGISTTHQQHVTSRDLRKIAPDMRTELTTIATAVLEFLHNISHIKSTDDGLRLLADKTSLLRSLNMWLADLESGQAQIRPPEFEPLSMSFTRLFHRILRIVLLHAFRSPSDRDAELRVEHNRLLDLGSHVGERVKGYRMNRETRDQMQPSR
ncbi:hypothetical protein K491DRAFT_587058 [Lophiostoma macrostomum CBS 122681]|uniref:Zn(2)-C6 fungal-type domain-containing protein n=1 Tax=Lophiostoma macrostomum CBS 122681 TaxID=1314788 RepID=A0A6A6TRD1_9PLEO|nr:hypothetical protein K491DRAFT_587058 [Lophiostoma macrostomum CBS 122681]